MKHNKDQYQNYKSSLSKLLKENELVMMSSDTEVVNRIFNLLTEGKTVEKIEGIILNTEIIKYGGDISDKRTHEVYLNILDWWTTVDLLNEIHTT